MIIKFLIHTNQNFFISFMKCRNFSSQKIAINLTPLQYLEQKINNGELIDDSHQKKLCQGLNEVFLKTTNYTPVKSTFISRIFGRKENARAPKGLYLYGAVGGGKTMLMDLFYECVTVSSSSRYLFINKFNYFIKNIVCCFM